jgi:GntR family transcriptional regulator, transcriptional repressor for pyruvate dehydrogenase complex
MPSPDDFEPISRKTISAQVRAQILKRIMMGELAPGARIPSERVLSDQFQVARTSVREAIQGLLSLGVVVRRNNRSYVAEHLPGILVEQAEGRDDFVTQLFETRRVLEGPIFALAAARASDPDRSRIMELVKMFQNNGNIAEFRRLDREFHTTVAAACGNPLLIELYGKVLDRLFRSTEFDGLLSDSANQSEVQHIMADSVAAHARIAAAVASGDVDAAERASAQHVSSVERAMVETLS